MTALTELRADVTQRLILDSAVSILESGGDVTMRAVAKEAGMSERTMFRYFATREELLDAVAREVRRLLATPSPPRTLDELIAFPRALYTALDAKKQLVVASRHSAIFGRMVGATRERWASIDRIVNDYARRAPEAKRKSAAANIRYFLSATTWHYYRVIFKFSLEETIGCAELAIQNALRGLTGS
jgi:AcrR family transcriptional regulator